MNTHKNNILTLAHIPKAGGTTLIYVLRKNYFMRSCDVRYLSNKNVGIFTAEDMKKIKMMNPFIKCIMGHNIRPHGDLKKSFPSVDYITVLRDPINRYISHYQHRIYEKNEKYTFEDYLENKLFSNYQTKFIAGEENIDKAKKILANDFFMVGVLEEFDEFLLLLEKKVWPRKLDKTYKKMRVAGKNQEKEELKKKYMDRMLEENKLDIELYDYVRKELISKSKKEYGDSFDEDLNTLKQNINSNKKFELRLFIDFLFRRLYYEPILWMLRAKQGLPAKGLPKNYVD